ncbi:MAG: hypothetical protein HQ526_09805 [Actinobacteria bacterium]|nr:hypothetical protein [Actinomycetota bacterium]
MSRSNRWTRVRARVFAIAALVLISIVASTSVASAHGVQGRAETPIPIAAFFLAAGVVLVVSFVGLTFGWSKPILAKIPWWRAPSWIERPLLASVTIGAGRAVVLVLFLFVAATAAFGSERIGSNPAPLIIFVIWWVGLVPISAIFGNIWRELNPWATLALLLRAPRKREGRTIPHLVGYWPPALVLLLFAWFELVYPTPASPRLVAALIIVYTALTLAAMYRWGVDAWLDQGEAFTVYTGLLALLSPVEMRVIDGKR